MVIRKIFDEYDHDKIKAIITANPLAAVVSYSDAGLEANHIPLLLTESSEKKLILQGHIAKANPLWKITPKDVLVIFSGPDSYISPSYYPSKQIDGKAVPTWNYVAVHIQGSLRFIHDAEWCLDLVSRLSDQHEHNRSNPWSVSDAPQEYIDKMLSAVVGIEIEVESLVCKAKTSQNQTAENKNGVVNGLLSENESHHSHQMAALVKHS